VINSTTNIMTQQAEPDDYILENGFNLSAHFRQFNLESDRKSKESGFYVDGNLHQIL
jgi:polyisoprenoid-binding protein YceI